jgi:hypothetical protein
VINVVRYEQFAVGYPDTILVIMNSLLLAILILF